MPSCSRKIAVPNYPFLAKTLHVVKSNDLECTCRLRIARLLGIKAKSPQQIDLRFNELSLAVSDPFVVVQRDLGVASLA